MKTFHRRDCVFTYLQLHMKEMSDILTSWIKSLTFCIASIIERIHISTNTSLREERDQSFDIFIAGIIEGYRLYFMHANFTDVKTVMFSYFLFQILSFNQSCFVSNCQLLQIDFFHTKVFRM